MSIEIARRLVDGEWVTGPVDEGSGGGGATPGAPVWYGPFVVLATDVPNHLDSKAFEFTLPEGSIVVDLAQRLIVPWDTTGTPGLALIDPDDATEFGTDLIVTSNGNFLETANTWGGGSGGQTSNLGSSASYPLWITADMALTIHYYNGNGEPVTAVGEAWVYVQLVTPVAP